MPGRTPWEFASRGEQVPADHHEGLGTVGRGNHVVALCAKLGLAPVDHQRLTAEFHFGSDNSGETRRCDLGGLPRDALGNL